MESIATLTTLDDKTISISTTDTQGATKGLKDRLIEKIIDQDFIPIRESFAGPPQKKFDGEFEVHCLWLPRVKVKGDSAEAVIDDFLKKTTAVLKGEAPLFSCTLFSKSHPELPAIIEKGFTKQEVIEKVIIQIKPLISIRLIFS